ncbi:MAG: hypothetical protein ACE5HE_11575 [Phycisphaerae bacterium]
MTEARSQAASTVRAVDVSPVSFADGTGAMGARFSEPRQTHAGQGIGMAGSWAAIWYLCVCWMFVCGTASAQLDTADLHARVMHLTDRVEALTDKHDLLDGLHFGWFDRPYARATLAVLIKTCSALRREVHLRQRGNGAISDSSVNDMLAWADDALARVIASRSDPRFRPHRLRVTSEQLRGESFAPALFGFVDRATTTRAHPTLGDLDLEAALGFRVYPRLAGELGAADVIELRKARVAALGMAPIVVLAEPVLLGWPGARSATGAGSAEPSTGDVLIVRPVSLRTLVQHVPSSDGRLGSVIAVVDPPRGERWASSLARRALVRGTLRQVRYTTVGWTPPHAPHAEASRPEAIAAAMWVDAIGGQSIGLLPGWRDLRDGSASPYSSVLAHPRMIEVFAHTGLDLLRLGSHLPTLWDGPRVAVMVGSDAVDPHEENAWAAWIEGVWQVLYGQQVRYDVVGSGMTRAEVSQQYSIVLELHRDTMGDLASLLLDLQQQLDRQSTQPPRVTVHEMDERLAADIFVATGKVPKGRCVALANLSNRTRMVRLRNARALGDTIDVLSGSPIPSARAPLELAPWQVRILCPSERS